MLSLLMNFWDMPIEMELMLASFLKGRERPIND
jgi:hypothetical protein